VLVAVVLPLERRDARVMQHHDAQQFVAHARHELALLRRRILAIVADNLVVCLPEQQRNDTTRWRMATQLCVLVRFLLTTSL